MAGGSSRDLRYLQNSDQVKDALGELLSGRKGYQVSDGGPKFRACPGCRARIKEMTKFCPQCGMQLEQKKEIKKPTTCPKCTASLAPDQIFCAECGTKIEVT